MNEDSVETRLCNFFGAPLRAAPYSGVAAETLPPLSFENAPRLADLLEYAVRGMGLRESSRSDADGSLRRTLPERLIEELTTAQEQMRAAPPVSYEAAPDGAAEFAGPAAPEDAAMLHQEELLYGGAAYGLAGAVPGPVASDLVEEDLGEKDLAPLAGLDLPPPSAEQEPVAEPEAADRKAAGPLHRLQAEDWIRSQAAGLMLADRPERRRLRIPNLLPWMRFKEWDQCRLALLSHIHRHVFDRGTEQLLFYKTAPLNGGTSPFSYEGPMPRLLLDWTLTALPRDLKRYAFIDFRAGNGRTLLFAARHQFEYAAGYAFDAASTEILEMNLAQYPRTRLACRDVRALRGDRDGVVIPSQPAVLFFPDGLSGGHLDIILNYVSASLRASPRPLYLIFENAGREVGLEQMSLFEDAPLPLFHRGMAWLFAPARVAVYRSKTGIAS